MRPRISLAVVALLVVVSIRIALTLVNDSLRVSSRSPHRSGYCGRDLLDMARRAPEDRTDSLGSSAEFPAIAPGPDDRALVAWVDTRNGGRDVRARLFGPSARPLGPSRAVGGGPVPTQFFRLVAVAGCREGYGVLWGSRGQWLDRGGRPVGPEVRVFPSAASEPALAPWGERELLACSGRSLRRWGRHGTGPTLTYLQEPSVPCEPCLFPVGDGSIWIAWHDAFEMRRLPALGDNLFIFFGRVSLAN